MIPYFSMIRTPGDLIIYALAGALCASLGAWYGITLEFKKGEIPKIYLMGLLGFAIYVIFTWILIGDSTSWSEPIGLWLRGR